MKQSKPPTSMTEASAILKATAKDLYKRAIKEAAGNADVPLPFRNILSIDPDLLFIQLTDEHADRNLIHVNQTAIDELGLGQTPHHHEQFGFMFDSAIDGIPSDDGPLAFLRHQRTGAVIVAHHIEMSVLHGASHKPGTALTLTIAWPVHSRREMVTALEGPLQPNPTDPDGPQLPYSLWNLWAGEWQEMFGPPKISRLQGLLLNKLQSLEPAAQFCLAHLLCPELLDILPSISQVVEMQKTYSRNHRRFNLVKSSVAQVSVTTHLINDLGESP